MSKLLIIPSISILKIIKYFTQKEQIDNLSICKKLRTLICFLKLNLTINPNNIKKNLINFYKNLKLIYTLSKLKKLLFSCCAIINTDLIGISKLSNLEELNLVGCRNIENFTEIFKFKFNRNISSNKS